MKYQTKCFGGETVSREAISLFLSNWLVAFLSFEPNTEISLKICTPTLCECGELSKWKVALLPPRGEDCQWVTVRSLIMSAHSELSQRHGAHPGRRFAWVAFGGHGMWASPGHWGSQQPSWRKECGLSPITLRGMQVTPVFRRCTLICSTNSFSNCLFLSYSAEQNF